MASSQNLKICDHFRVAPPASTPQTSFPPTFFDLFWIRFHPVERIFFYTLPTPLSHPSTFFTKLVPSLKTSLSHTLHHFPTLAGNVVWHTDSPNPVVEYVPGDAVSVTVAESEADFNHVLDKTSPHEASESRCLVPHLESSDSHASVLSIQITLFPNRGFSIGISTHHAVLDGKSATVFLKAWASMCQQLNTEPSESPSLPKKFEPFFDRSVIKSPTELGLTFTNNWTEILTKLFPHENSDGRCLKLLPFPPRLEDHVRQTFTLTRADLDKLRKEILSKWDIVESESESKVISKPSTLSTFVITNAYVLVCIAKAYDRVEKGKHKFSFAFTVDCRARLEPPIPDNYFGNCVWGLLVETEPLDYVKEEGVVFVAKGIDSRIKKMLEEGVFDGANSVLARYKAMASEGIEIVGIAGSNRFGVYEIDFGWGKASKVEIMSIDRALTIGLAESREESGGVEVGLVLNKHVMHEFGSLFHSGVSKH